MIIVVIVMMIGGVSGWVRVGNSYSKVDTGRREEGGWFMVGNRKYRMLIIISSKERS